MWQGRRRGEARENLFRLAQQTHVVCRHLGQVGKTSGGSHLNKEDTLHLDLAIVKKPNNILTIINTTYKFSNAEVKLNWKRSQV